MSMKVGTLQETRPTRSIWPAAVVATLVMLTIAVGAVSLGRDRPQSSPNTGVGTIEQTFVGGTAANTPSELRGATEAVGGRIRPGARDVPRRAAEAATGSSEVGTAVNTPSELSGGLTALGEARAGHQRI